MHMGMNVSGVNRQQTTANWDFPRAYGVHHERVSESPPKSEQLLKGDAQLGVIVLLVLVSAVSAELHHT